MNPPVQPRDSSRDKLLSLLASNAYRYGTFTLSSGRKSNHYVNCKPVTLNGFGLLLLSDLLLTHVKADSVAVAGLTLGADPLVSGVAMAAAQKERVLNALIVRKEPKGHGTDAWIEGPLPPKGSEITILEDVVTTGASSLKAVSQLSKAGYKVNMILAIVDRQEGAAMEIQKAGLLLTSLFNLDELVERAQELLK